MALAHLFSLPPGGRPSRPDPRVSDPALSTLGLAHECEPHEAACNIVNMSFEFKPGSVTSQGVNLSGSLHLSEPQFPLLNVGPNEVCVKHQAPVKDSQYSHYLQLAPKNLSDL